MRVYDTIDDIIDEALDAMDEIDETMSNHPYGKIDLRRYSAGTPETYKAALKEWNLFVDFYNKFYAPLPYPDIIFALDTILDIAPKINDQTTMKKVLKHMKTMTLHKYAYNMVYSVFNMADELVRFRKNCITDNPAKQKALVGLFSSYFPIETHPAFSDATWYFYVWRQFGIVKVSKQGRFNYISNP